MSDVRLTIWVLYWNPKDFPNQFVIRGQDVILGPNKRGSDEPAEIVVHREVVVGGDRATIEAAFHRNHPGLRWIERDPRDEPQIVGSWV